MLDANDLLKAIKKAAQDAVRASRPTEVCYGKVVNISPLSVSVDQKLTIPAKKLTILQPLSERLEDASITPNRLSVGDDLVLLRKQGGQEYVVLGRIKL